MECPRCGLENPPSSELCDCGYRFVAGARLGGRVPSGPKTHIVRDHGGESTDRRQYVALERISATFHMLARIAAYVLVILGMGSLLGILYQLHEAGDAGGPSIVIIVGAVIFAALCFCYAYLGWLIFRAIGEAIILFVDIAYDVNAIAGHRAELRR